jgi:hypothetical protein
MIKSVRPFSSLFMHYLSERDVLTAHMARFGAGFVMENNLREAKEQVGKIQALIDEVDLRKGEQKPKFDVNCDMCYKK